MEMTRKNLKDATQSTNKKKKFISAQEEKASKMIIISNTRLLCQHE